MANKEFGLKLKKMREELGISQENLAKELGYDFSTINRWENGKSDPSTEKQEKVFDYFESKGIKITNDLVIEKLGFKLVSSSKLKSWFSENTRTSQGLFPELIRNLILETLGNNVFVNFPTFDEINSPGFDGVVETTTGNMFVPKGKSYWELGASLLDSDKARHDCITRTNNMNQEVKSNSILVLVNIKLTANNLEFKDWFIDCKKQWKDIKVVDVTYIELWLSYCINTSVWLYNQFENSELQINTINTSWDEIKNQCKYNLVPELFLSKRIDDTNKLLKLIKDKKQQITIKAPSKKEAYWFTIASLLNNDLDYKVLIINDYNTFKELDVKFKNKIFILNFDYDNNIYSNNNTYIWLYGYDVNESISYDIKLIERSYNDITNILRQNMNVDENIITKIRHNKNSKLNSVMKMISKNDIDNYQWHKKIIDDSLLPLVIMERIDFNNELDIKILESLLKDFEIDKFKNKDQYYRLLMNFLTDDFPIAKYKESFKVTDKQALFNELMKNKLLFNFEPIKSLLIDYFTNHSDYYKEPIIGIIDFLTLCDIKKSSNELYSLWQSVFDSLNGINQILSFTNLLYLISECCPSFVVNIIEEFVSKKNKLSIILDEANEFEEYDYQNIFSNIMFALRNLILFEDYKRDVCNIVYDMFTKDEFKKFKEDIKRFIMNEFWFYNNDNALSLCDKKVFIQEKIKDNKKDFINLVIELLKEHISTRNSMEFKWRVSDINYEPITYDMIFDLMNTWINGILKVINASEDIKCFIEILKGYMYYNKTIMETLIDYIKNNYQRDTDEAQMIYNIVLAKLYAIKSHKITKEEYLLPVLDQAIELLKPTNKIKQNLIFFKNIQDVYYNEEKIKDDKYNLIENVEQLKVLYKNLASEYGEKELLINVIKVIPENSFSAEFLFSVIANVTQTEVIKLILENGRYYLLMYYLNKVNIEDAKHFLDNDELKTNDKVVNALSTLDLDRVPQNYFEKPELCKSIFNRRYPSNNLSRNDIELFIKYNPLELLEFETNDINRYGKDRKEYREKEEIIKQILNSIDLNIKNNLNQSYDIEQALTILERNPFDGLAKLEFKLLPLVSFRTLPLYLNNYLILHPNAFIRIVEKYSIDDVFNVNYNNIICCMHFDINISFSKITEFIQTIKMYNENEQVKREMLIVLGKIFAHSLKIDEFINENELIKELNNIPFDEVLIGFIRGYFDNHGAYMVDDGSNHFNLAKKIDEIMKKIQFNYQFVHKILMVIKDQEIKIGNMDKDDYNER